MNKTNPIHFKWIIFSVFGLLLFLPSCKRDNDPVSPEPQIPAEYGIWVWGGSPSTTYGFYMLTVKDIMKDTVLSIVGAGIETNAVLDYGNSIFKDGYFYQSLNGKFSKGTIQEGKYVELDNIVADVNFGGGFDWNGDELIVSSKVSDFQLQILVIDTKNMTLKSARGIKIPPLETPIKNPITGENQDVTTNIRQCFVNKDKLVIGIFYETKSKPETTSENLFLYTLDYPSLQNPVILTDNRAGVNAGPVPPYLYQHARDDAGNIYFFTSTPIIAGTKSSKPGNAIMRMKPGENRVDRDYLFMLPDSLENIHNFSANMGGGIVCSGEGRYILDLPNKRLKVDLQSYGKGDWVRGLINQVEDGKMYTFVRNKGWSVYRYDPKTDEFKKGVSIDPGIFAVYRNYKFR